MKRILVASDGSPDAERAVDAAARLAKDGRCELVILTVGGSITGAELRALAGKSGDLSKTLETAARTVLAKARKRALRIGAPSVREMTAWGEAAEAINDAARREKADILVVGRRGRGRLSGLLLGSVSQKVTALAPCPVMVVP
ncbi:MAG TPA: universal stress protein [Pseudolabrys sp.]|nr:universal stress protein [Pseudolabrys sp.]